MRIISALLIIAFILIFILLVASFIYFEKTVHQNFYYLFKKEGLDRGDIEIDKYITEENIIYKSKMNRPYNLETTKKEIRLEVDKGIFSLKLYEETASSGSLKELLYLKKERGTLNFLAIGKSKFAYLESMEINEDAFFFDRYAPVSFMPFVKMYNFRKGGTQSFNAIKYDVELLPPSRFVLTLTSIRDEYVQVDDKKIKSECLILNTPFAEQIYVWVDKKEHDIIAVEIPAEQIYIIKTEKRRNFVVKDYLLRSQETVSQKISFATKDIELNGLLTRPKKDGVYPAVILFQGEEALDSDNFGLFAELGNYLAQAGYVTFGFEASYIGERFEFKSLSVADEWKALDIALMLLKDFRFVYPNQIGIIAHADANYILPALLRKDDRLKTWVMLSPLRLAPIVDLESESIKAIIEKIKTHDKNYENDITRMRDATLKIVTASTKNGKNIMGRKVFLKRMKEILELNPWDDMKDISMPILVLQGKGDSLYSLKYLEKIENYVKDNNEKRTLVYFRKLNHYLGTIEKGVLVKNHYKVDKEAPETILGWLDKNLKVAIETVEPNLTK